MGKDDSIAKDIKIERGLENHGNVNKENERGEEKVKENVSKTTSINRWRKFGILMGVMVAVFLIGLIGYYIFSAEGEDGLEKTMSDNNVTEGEPTVEAPLDYGENYGQSAIIGIAGGIITGGAAYLIFWIYNQGKKTAAR